MPVGFLMRNKKVMDLDGKGSEQELLGIGGGKSVIRIYCMKKIYCQLKIKICMRPTLVCYWVNTLKKLHI